MGSVAGDAIINDRVILGGIMNACTKLHCECESEPLTFVRDRSRSLRVAHDRVALGTIVQDPFRLLTNGHVRNETSYLCPI